MSGARPDTWMPFYIGDYLADTMHLTRDQHGAYMLLIFAYWRRGGPLPDDDAQLAAIARAPVGEWRRRLRSVIEPFFQVENGGWSHKRIDVELRSAVSVSEAKRQAGRRGGEAARGRSGRPKNNSIGNSEKIAEQIANELQNNTPSQSQKKEEGSTEFSLSTELNSETPSSRSRVAARKNSRDRSKPKTSLPSHWEPSENGKKFAISRGYDVGWICREAEAFRSRALAADARYADWDAAWRTWVLNAPKFAGNGGKSHVNGYVNDAGLAPSASIVAGLERAVRELEGDSGPDRNPAEPVLDSI